MIMSKKQKNIPERLYHYTSLDALKNILSDEDGKGICFWAFSNKNKNDDQEIKMGEYMLKRILYSESFPENSLLHQFGGYENIASVSFMEGEINQHMLDVYGHYRLELDLRKHSIGILPNGLIDCEYVDENDLKEYADECCDLICEKYNSIKVAQKKYGHFSAFPINNLADFIIMEIEIMRKVFCLKEKKWEEECEWRKVVALKDNILRHNGKPYTKYYLDKNTLTGITVFSSRYSMIEAKKEVEELKRYIIEKGYRAEVKIDVL